MKPSHFNISPHIIHTHTMFRACLKTRARQSDKNEIPSRDGHSYRKSSRTSPLPLIHPISRAPLKGHGAAEKGEAFRGNGANENFNKPNGRDRRLSRDFSRVPPTFFLFPLGLRSPTTDFQYPIPFINGKC